MNRLAIKNDKAQENATQAIPKPTANAENKAINASGHAKKTLASVLLGPTKKVNSAESGHNAGTKHADATTFNASGTAITTTAAKLAASIFETM